VLLIPLSFGWGAFPRLPVLRTVGRTFSKQNAMRRSPELSRQTAVLQRPLPAGAGGNPWPGLHQPVKCETCSDCCFSVIL
jgi:hypothetical protein